MKVLVRDPEQPRLQVGALLELRSEAYALGRTFFLNRVSESEGLRVIRIRLRYS